MCSCKIIVVNGAVFGAVMAVFFVDTFSEMAFLKLLINGCIHSVWIMGLYFIANFIFNKSAFKTLFELWGEKA